MGVIKVNADVLIGQIGKLEEQTLDLTLLDEKTKQTLTL